MNNNDIFLEFWKNYQWAEPATVFYRLYHDDHGRPLFYSMEDLPGSYVEITPDQYAESNSQVLVKDKKLVPQLITRSSKLVPESTGTPCHPQDVCIVVDSDVPARHWKIKHSNTG